jgi:hypothetical protein
VLQRLDFAFEHSLSRAGNRVKLLHYVLNHRLAPHVILFFQFDAQSCNLGLCRTRSGVSCFPFLRLLALPRCRLGCGALALCGLGFGIPALLWKRANGH